MQDCGTNGKVEDNPAELFSWLVQKNEVRTRMMSFYVWERLTSRMFRIKGLQD